ncbi:MAG TPA: hypothetical protein VFU32_05160 [Ktedonobacterales bacterium]|nr:hypothetical protein [Ktedonobacterales bacterium]
MLPFSQPIPTPTPVTFGPTPDEAIFEVIFGVLGWVIIIGLVIVVVKVLGAMQRRARRNHDGAWFGPLGRTNLRI